MNKFSNQTFNNTRSSESHCSEFIKENIRWVKKIEVSRKLWLFLECSHKISSNSTAGFFEYLNEISSNLAAGACK